VTYPWNVTLGDYVWIGDRAELYSLGTINIGNHSVISQGSYICAATHDYKCIDFPLINKTVTIQDEVWIATGVFIAPGVTIGEGAMIGAKAVVLNDVAPAKIVAGNPAKEIRDRQKNV
jgi:putative colanic acid biosynthesis acetyltransferase WcaF